MSCLPVLLFSISWIPWKHPLTDTAIPKIVLKPFHKTKRGLRPRNPAFWYEAMWQCIAETCKQQDDTLQKPKWSRTSVCLFIWPQLLLFQRSENVYVTNDMLFMCILLLLWLITCMFHGLLLYIEEFEGLGESILGFGPIKRAPKPRRARFMTVETGRFNFLHSALKGRSCQNDRIDFHDSTRSVRDRIKKHTDNAPKRRCQHEWGLYYSTKQDSVASGKTAERNFFRCLQNILKIWNPETLGKKNTDVYHLFWPAVNL